MHEFERNVKFDSATSFVYSFAEECAGLFRKCYVVPCVLEN
jgi:hypothetical protein